MFGIVIAVVFQSVFRLKIYFSFKKIILNISTLKRSKNTKNIFNFLQKHFLTTKTKG